MDTIDTWMVNEKRDCKVSPRSLNPSIILEQLSKISEISIILTYPTAKKYIAIS